MPTLREMTHRQLTRLTHRIYSLPIVVLMPHSRCNCRCVMCDIWKANQRKQEISFETLNQHIATFRRLGVRWVVLSGGEALLHQNLWALCELLKTIPTRISLLSTGLLLKPHVSHIIRWCDEVIVSLDGSRDVHDAIRRIPHAYDQLAVGVTSLRHDQPDFRVTARCVVQRRNYRDLPWIIEAAHNLGLDQISFLAADVSTTAFNRPEAQDATRVNDLALSEAEVNELGQIIEQVIDQYAADFSSGFIAENPEKLRRIAQYFAALNGTAEFPPVRCNAPWVSTVVEADGTVRPCFFHPPLGNIHDQSVDQIVNGAAAQRFRRQLDTASDPICRSCTCSLYLGSRSSV